MEIGGLPCVCVTTSAQGATVSGHAQPCLSLRPRLEAIALTGSPAKALVQGSP
jgi:hypothetical protein